MKFRSFDKWLSDKFDGLTITALLQKAGLVNIAESIEGEDGELLIVESGAAIGSGFGVSNADLEEFDGPTLVPTNAAVRALVDARAPLYSELDAVTTINGTDLILLQVAGEFKKITFDDFVTAVTTAQGA